jgi:hypothetical protein
VAAARAIPVQEAIDQIGFGRFQKRLLGVCGVTWAARREVGIRPSTLTKGAQTEIADAAIFSSSFTSLWAISSLVGSLNHSPSSRARKHS